MKKDYQDGTFLNGKFRPYERHGEYDAKVDRESERSAQEQAREGKVLHGTYKEGIFRPAEISRREGYAQAMVTGKGEKHWVDHQGKLYDTQGKEIGKVGENGQAKFYQTVVSSRSTARRDIESEPHQKRRIGYGGRRDIEAETNEQLTDLANYLSRSNKVLGKLRKAQKGYDPKTGTAIRVYEAEIPEFNETTRLGAGFNAETQDGKEHVIVIDKRLKPYEKMAALAHELSHVYGGRAIKSNADLVREEHDTHLATIDLLTTLYEDYDALQRATVGKKDSYFATTSQPKREVGQAVAHLVQTRKVFGIRDDEIAHHNATFKAITHHLRNNLESRVHVFIAIPALVIGSVALSNNITGNVIGISKNTSSAVGIGLLMIGLMCTYFWFNNRKRSSFN